MFWSLARPDKILPAGRGRLGWRRVVGSGFLPPRGPTDFHRPRAARWRTERPIPVPALLDAPITKSAAVTTSLEAGEFPVEELGQAVAVWRRSGAFLRI
jgi:hypothetical protein